MTTERERWATRVGLVLALAGNAIGLGNFLRFPRQVALHGGGAFLIPYLVCLLAVGIPLLWVELAIGRYGGMRGSGHTAGILPLLWRHPAARVIGALGLFIPFAVATYYVYVESWCLAYAFFSLTGQYFGLGGASEIGRFLAGFQGTERNAHFDGLGTAYVFFTLTFALNLLVLSGGVARGIERLARIAMPALFVIAGVLVVRVLTLAPPAGSDPTQSVSGGLAFIWRPDFSALGDPGVWLAAGGQILFTLSVGWGIVQAYASYIGRDDDLPLTGVASASLNEFAEVILGGTIALTAAVVFFGVTEARAVAEGGSFDLAFQSMPLVIEQLPAAPLFGTLWFLLLFLAGITSSVALLQPLVCLLAEDFGMPHRRAVALAGALLWLGCQPVILFLSHGFLDELDFWAGGFALLVFGFLEALVFTRGFGMTRGWEEISRGARLALPRFYRGVIAWVLPSALGAILLAWSATELGAAVDLSRVPVEDRPYVLAARIFLLGLLAAAIAAAWAGSRAAARRERGRMPLAEPNPGSGSSC